MRSFIAVALRNEKIQDVLEELRAVKADTKVVKPENLHLTLNFLGEIPQEKIDDIYDVMKNSLKTSPFNVDLHGLGAFPSVKRIRVIWVGFRENADKFIQMNCDLEENLERLGFKREYRFHPHLTIARVKSPRGKEELQALLEKYKDVNFGVLHVSKVELKKSVLTPKGPIYSTLREVTLE
ncbi:MAG: RNA 2',3'-cyclic phosphodiesterase [Candidatus Hydrothermarchaeales archaeon]